MWIFLSNAFLSVVQHKDDPSMFVVRARRIDDLVSSFPDQAHEVVVLADADYPYRLIMHRGTFLRFVGEAVEDVRYVNFKNSVAPHDKDRKAFLHKVWTAGYEFGKKLPLVDPPPAPPKPEVSYFGYPHTPLALRDRASRFSWQREDMRRPAPMDYRDVFTWAEWRELRRGYIPEVMEEKWFIYEGEGTLHLHRSWTGFETYRVTLRPTNDGMEVISASYESDVDLYRSGGPRYEEQMVRWLLRSLVLGQQVEFPTYPDTPEWATALGLAQHHVGGREASAHLEPTLAAAVDALARERDRERERQQPMATIEVLLGDITTLAVDAIVNAANNTLAPGGGVSGAIHKAAGPRLAKECAEVGVCPTGEARITGAYGLPADHVIHAVGPRWEDGSKGEPILLASAYRAAFELAEAHELQSIALPALGAGVHGYPLREAAEIAVREARAAAKRSKALERIIFCCFTEEVRAAFHEAMDLV